MLVLLSAPRGRVSAARVAARIREHDDAHRSAVHPPRAPAEAAAPERHLHALRAEGDRSNPHGAAGERVTR